MKKINTNSLLISVLIFIFLNCVVKSVSASIEDECRQEAEEFDVMPELQDDYINGCIESRGGVSTLDSTEEDYILPPEQDDTIYSDVSSGETAE
jgi:hypothetical protein